MKRMHPDAVMKVCATELDHLGDSEDSARLELVGFYSAAATVLQTEIIRTNGMFDAGNPRRASMFVPDWIANLTAEAEKDA